MYVHKLQLQLAQGFPKVPHVHVDVASDPAQVGYQVFCIGFNGQILVAFLQSEQL